MRRFAFYVLIGLLAFGIGLSVVFCLYFKPQEKPLINQTLEKNEPKNEPSDLVETPPNPAVEESLDEDEAAFLALMPTIEKWLSGARIKSILTYASDESIREMTGKERDELDAFWVNELRFIPTLMDFDGDGKNELAITNGCAPVGNCRLTVFRQKGKSYEIILESDGGAIQTFMCEKTKTNGYFDLKTTSHGDAWSGGIEIYKFDGKKYKVAECFNYDYAALVNGKHTVWKNPRITPRKCASE